MNLLIAFGLVHVTVEQLSALNAAYAGVSLYFVRHAVTPVANPKDNQGNSLTP
jgi:hypothetical protein